MNSPAAVVAILFNADDSHGSAARRRELLSEHAVAGAAREAAADLAAAGFRPRLVPVRGRIEDLLGRLRRLRPAAVVNLCEGFCGQSAGEPRVAGLLELMGVPFTGNPSAALGLCRDKFRVNAVLRAHGLPVPRGWLLTAADPLPVGLPFPVIVKPNAEDASLGIYPRSVVRTPAALRTQVARVTAAYGAPALVEPFLSGREFNAGLIEAPDLRVLPLAEITYRRFPRGQPRLLNYDAKWRPRHPAYRGTVPVCPARLAPALARRLASMACEAFRRLNLRGYARVDIRLDGRGRPLLLDVNPNPDTSRDAGLARMLKAAGMSGPAFWKHQLDLVLTAG